MSQWSTVTSRSERWKREDDSPRLTHEVPALMRLRLELAESFEDRKILDSERISHIIVERAAARFEVPCSNDRCEDGGHNLTRDIIASLKAFKPSFSGQDRCGGYVGDQPCGRVLAFVAHAEFDLDRTEMPPHSRRFAVTE